MSQQTKADKAATAAEEKVEQEFLAKQVGTPEGKNVYEYQTSSTETATISVDDFWKLKLIS